MYLSSLSLVPVMLALTAARYNIGMLFNSDNSYRTSASYNRIINFTLGRQSDTSINLILREYQSGPSERYRAICSLVEEDVVAVITISSSTSTAQEADHLNLMGIPLIAISATNPFIKTSSRPLLIRMSPPDIFQGVAIFDLLKHYSWTDFCVLASSDDYGINGMIGLLGKASSDRDMKLVGVEYFDPAKIRNKTDLRPSLENIRNSFSRVIVLNCGASFADMVFDLAKEMGLMAEGFVWIVTDSIASQFIAPDNRFDGILGTVPIKKEKEKVESFKFDYFQEVHYADPVDVFAWTLMLYDTLNVIDQALRNLTGVRVPSSAGANCSTMESWPGGRDIYKSIISQSLPGLTGDVSFDGQGLVNSNAYTLKNIKEKIFQPVGWWTSGKGVFISNEDKIHFIGGPPQPPTGKIESLSGRNLVLGTIFEPPYSIKIKTEFCKNRYWDPDCWTGFDFDLLLRLSRDLNFTYTIKEPEDNQYGVYDKEKQRFTGLIYDLQQRHIDMISTPIIINYERSSAVEFLSDVMIAKSMSIYIGSDHQFENPLFFLAPLDPMLWVVMILIIVVLGIILSLLSRMSPCLSKDEPAESPLRPISFYHGVFLIACGIVGSKGWNGIPNSPAVRFVLIAWWFFTTIIISMYTANLTAFITFEHVSNEIHALEDLLVQSKYTWGTIKGSAEIDMLMNRRQTDFSLIAENSQNLLSIFEAQSKVKDGNYVFIYDDLTIGHTFKQFCNASTFHNELPSSGLSFAVAKNSPLQKVLSSYILKYKEEGYIGELKSKWFQDNYNYCTEHVHTNRKSFKIKVLSGLFYMAAIGVLFAFFLSIMEYFKIAYSVWRYSPSNTNFIKVLYSVVTNSTWRRTNIRTDEVTSSTQRKPQTADLRGETKTPDEEKILDVLQALVVRQTQRVRQVHHHHHQNGDREKGYHYLGCVNQED